MLKKSLAAHFHPMQNVRVRSMRSHGYRIHKDTVFVTLHFFFILIIFCYVYVTKCELSLTALEIWAVSELH